MNTELMNPTMLAKRWYLSTNTLSQWRWQGKGPKYLKLGGRVMYRIQDIESFEQEKVCESTSHAATVVMA